MTTGYIVDTFISLVNGISETITAVKEFLKIILEVNNNVMAILIQSTANFLSGIWAVLKFIYLVIYTLTVCVGDFVMELVNFMSAFLYLLWKVVLLFYSLLDLAFHFVECLCYFIWTGGKWTAETIKVSGQNLTENGLSTWKYFVLSLQEFTSSIIGGFAMIGACVQTSAIHIFQGFCLSYNYVCELMYDIDGKVKDMVRLCTDNIYFFVKDYLLNMPREAYLGIIAASESEMSEINIQLPDVSNRKNMQRSATPARFNKEMSPEDLKRCIALEKEKRICVVCQDQNKSVLILPCRHMCLCVDCGDQIARSRSRSRRVCPLCRTKINTIMNDQSKSVLILPCRHMCLCVECWNQIA
ncbi:RNF26-like protein, partial [Mya arenaria]